MRRLQFRLLAAILCFVVGVTGVWSAGLFPAVAMPVLARIAPKLVFRPTLRACGYGYTQVYSLPDGQRMSEGSVCYDTSADAEEELRSLIARSSRIIERVSNVKNRHGQEGERIVLIASDESGKDRAAILWYGGDRCLLWVESPSLDTALLFENADAYAY
jgi:hypothetical protein